MKRILGYLPFLKQIQKVTRFNSSRYRLEKENREFTTCIPPNSLVLDAGAGDAPYRHLLEHTNYESADFELVEKPYGNTTYVCDLCSIPVEAERFDYIMFNQVMEHLSEPEKVLQELYRVLKPGGKLIYSAPLFYEEHEQPYDFYRYTQFSVRFMFERTGFEIERLNWLEGYFGTVAYELTCMAKYLPLNPMHVGNVAVGILLLPLMLVFKPSCFLLGMFFHRIECLAKYERTGFPKNYVGVIRKPKT